LGSMLGTHIGKHIGNMLGTHLGTHVIGKHIGNTHWDTYWEHIGNKYVWEAYWEHILGNILGTYWEIGDTYYWEADWEHILGNILGTYWKQIRNIGGCSYTIAPRHSETIRSSSLPHVSDRIGPSTSHISFACAHFSALPGYWEHILSSIP